MPFNVNEFKANVNKYGGLTGTSKFLVSITPPAWLLNTAQDNRNDLIEPQSLRFFCDSVNLPGMNIETVDYKPQGFGKTVKNPTGISLENITSTFYCDSDFKVMRFFQQWMQEITNYMGMYYGELNSFKNRTSFEMGYRKDYQCQMQILAYSSQNENSVLTYDIVEAYPVQIGSVQMGWEQNDQIMRIPVEFTYTSFNTRKDTLPINVSGGEGRGIGLFETIAQIGSIAGVISTFDRPNNVQDFINQASNLNILLKNL